MNVTAFLLKIMISKNHLMLGGMKMFDEPIVQFAEFYAERDDVAITALSKGLRGNSSALEPHLEANLKQCGAMALYHGRRMGMKTQEGFDALAAICFVLGDDCVEFFDDVFLNRMMLNPNLTPTEKLNRIIEVVIRKVPRLAPHISNDNKVRESA